MDALLDEDDWRVDRIIAAAQQRRSVPIQYAIAPDIRLRFVGFVWIIDDYEITATTGQCATDRGRIPATSVQRQPPCPAATTTLAGL